MLKRRNVKEKAGQSDQTLNIRLGEKLRSARSDRGRWSLRLFFAAALILVALGGIFLALVVA